MSSLFSSFPERDPAIGLPEAPLEAIDPAVGERFPDVILADQHGRATDLHEHRQGRRGLVVFHRSADW